MRSVIGDIDNEVAISCYDPMVRRCVDRIQTQADQILEPVEVCMAGIQGTTCHSIRRGVARE